MSTYSMVTASIQNNEVVFESDEAYKEAIKVGFFRIKKPADLDLKVGRRFAKTFTQKTKYNQFGALDVANGYLQSELNQTVRFTLERDNWNNRHIKQKKVKGAPNYSPKLQELGNKMHDIGVLVLQTILKKHNVPKKLWFEATGGSSHNKGSHYLLFNCYDPKNSDKPIGVAPHKDWSHVTVLDAHEKGLEAKIDGVWKALDLEDGYLTINFGYALEKLLPDVCASEHRVTVQTKKMRTSTVAFIDPRVGPFNDRKGEGAVYKYDATKKKLIEKESTISFFTRLSNELYGEKQD